MRKKLLVLSDTHGSVAAIAAVLGWAKDISPAAAVFLGDGLDDVEEAIAATGFSCRWHRVRGNNDFGFPDAEAATFDLAGHRFFACHGHRHNLYGGMDSLAAAARNLRADAALFGHTHVPHVGSADGVFLLNPGSLGSPRGGAGATFAVVECARWEPLRPTFWEVAFDAEGRPTVSGTGAP